MHPQAGHAVRITTDWWGGKAGDIGIIDSGKVGEDITDGYCLVCFRADAFRGPATGYSPPTAPIYVSCSGGPVPLIPVSELQPTEGTTTYTFWKWKDLPRGGGGIRYDLELPVWDWTPPQQAG